MTKLDSLKEILKGMDGILVAFSGGVDSSFLLKIAQEVKPGKVLAVTAISATYPAHELEKAKAVVGLVGAEHRIIETDELELEQFKNNPPDRCYYCKKELFSKLQKMADELGLTVVDGANADDVHDYRPGMRACKELGIRSPLKEAGLTKSEIRAFSKDMNLPTWNQPAYACLASRFPYGNLISREALTRVEAGEEVLRELGLEQLRVRDYGNLARIEVPAENFTVILDNRVTVVTKLKQLGYQYITLDIEGFRSGSMNEVLKNDN